MAQSETMPQAPTFVFSDVKKGLLWHGNADGSWKQKDKVIYVRLLTVFIARVHVGNGVVTRVVSKQQFVSNLLYVCLWLIIATVQ